MDCLFCKLRDQTAGKAVFEDEQCFVLEDIHPQAPVHLLVLPKKHLAGPDDAELLLPRSEAPGEGRVGVSSNDLEQLLGHLVLVAARLARERGVAKDGYRLVVNSNQHGGQTVFHLHVHLLGGRQMTWPPG